MKKILVMVSVVLGALTGCVGYAGDGYGRYADRYDGYGSGTTYYGSGYRNVDYSRGDRREYDRRQQDRRAAAIRERNKQRNDWRDRRDHDRNRGNSWNNRRDDNFRSSPRQTQRKFDSANRKLHELGTRQQR